MSSSGPWVTPIGNNANYLVAYASSGAQNGYYHVIASHSDQLDRTATLHVSWANSIELHTTLVAANGVSVDGVCTLKSTGVPSAYQWHDLNGNTVGSQAQYTILGLDSLPAGWYWVDASDCSFSGSTCWIMVGPD